LAAPQFSNFQSFSSCFFIYLQQKSPGCKLKKTLSSPFLGKKIIDFMFQNRLQMNSSALEKPCCPLSLQLIQPLSHWMLLVDLNHRVLIQ
jgi:hypothetical protein